MVLALSRSIMATYQLETWTKDMGWEGDSMWQFDTKEEAEQALEKTQKSDPDNLWRIQEIL